MKREIKFRAWDKEVKEMIQPCKVDLYTLSGKHFTILDKDDSVEIMQFTGLKDKNGKDIYEGDVVNRYHLTGIVEYHTERAMFIVRDGFNEPLFNDILGTEVIGNIYENPDLLQTKTPQP